MGQPRGPHRKGDGEEHGLVVDAGHSAEPEGDVDIGGGEHAGAVELGEQPGRPERHPGIEQIGVSHAACTPVSRRSLTATTSAGGGDHENTPHGCPSTRGTTAPVIPRRNRYSTPARCSPGR